MTFYADGQPALPRQDSRGSDGGRSGHNQSAPSVPNFSRPFKEHADSNHSSPPSSRAACVPPPLEYSYSLAPPSSSPNRSGTTFTGGGLSQIAQSPPAHVGYLPAIPGALPAQIGAMEPAHVDASDDRDSAYESESLLGDDTMTLASYITDYRFENGRRYHAYRDGAYWGPNDEHAAELVDLAHHMYLITLDNRLHLAPIVEPHRILDVGTGTGIWAIDMADKYPSASVLGTDLSPIQPDMVPPNCTFEVDDATLEWTFPTDHFDFIHVREMFGSIPDWEYFLEQAYRHTVPGGWVEIVEHSVEPISDDDTVGANHFFTYWGQTVVECGDKVGKTFRIWKEAKTRMQAAGFVDIVQVTYKWPVNGWPKEPKMRELGRWNQLRLHDGVESFMLRLLTTAGGWSFERAQVHLAEMRRAVKDYKSHAYLPGAVVYGRKPFR